MHLYTLMQKTVFRIHDILGYADPDPRTHASDIIFLVNRKKGFVSSVGNQTCKKPAKIRIGSKEKEVN
jgi:hypothetical protein